MRKHQFFLGGGQGQFTSFVYFWGTTKDVTLSGGGVFDAFWNTDGMAVCCKPVGCGCILGHLGHVLTDVFEPEALHTIHCNRANPCSMFLSLVA